MSACFTLRARVDRRPRSRTTGLAGVERAPACERPLSLAGAMLLAGVLVAAPRAARSGETVVTVKPLEPATSVWMLSAPHIGDRTCEVGAGERARFIARASHGQHRYAHIEVLEGACVGQQGYVALSYIQPRPATE